MRVRARLGALSALCVVGVMFVAPGQAGANGPTCSAASPMPSGTTTSTGTIGALGRTSGGATLNTCTDPEGREDLD